MNTDNTDNIEADQLHEIVNDGDYEALLAWIENRRPLVFSEPRHPNRSILVAAAWTGFYSVLKVLLNAHDWHSNPKDLGRALVAAMKAQHRRCILLLLDYGADPDAVDWWLVYESNDGEILRRFLLAKKNLDSFISELGGIGKPLISANHYRCRQPLLYLQRDHVEDPHVPLILAELPIRARISCGNGGRIRQGRARSPRSPTGFPPSPVHQAQRDG